GTTQGVEDSGLGTVFELPLASRQITTLAPIVNTTESTPNGDLVMDSSGNLFGTTWQGGPYGQGTVFEVAAGSGSITTLASFDGTNGSNPNGGLALDAAGNLFGTTTAGGASGSGTVFEVAKGSGQITTLATFDVDNGSDANGSLTLDATGNLFGTT